MTARTLTERLGAAAAAGLCLWYTLPVISGLNFLFPILALLWLICAGNLLKWLVAPPRPLRILLFIPWLITTLLNLLLSGNPYFSGWSNGVMLSLFTVIFVDYYIFCGRFTLLRRLCGLSLASYLAGALWAAVFATRDVVDVKMAMQVGGDGLFSANFGTYYAAVFVLGAGVWLLFSGRGWMRLMGAAAAGICALLLLRAQFTISILLALLLLLLMGLYFLLRRPALFWLLAVSLFLCALLLMPELGTLLIRVSAGIDSPLVAERVLDLGLYLRGSGESVHAATRMGLYEGDLQTFLRYPLTGSILAKLAGLSHQTILGGHNSLLRLLAEYGVLFSTGFLVFAFGPVVHAARLAGSPSHRRLWEPVATVYLILCCVNPTFNVPTLSFVMAAVLPLLGLLTLDREQVSALEEQYAGKSGAADYRGNGLLR